jgi:hypothetical protein
MADFTQNKLYEVQDAEKFWIGVETWTITDEKGTKTTKPGLVKRDKTTNRETGEVRTGKAKGLSIADIELIEQHMEQIKTTLRS